MNLWKSWLPGMLTWGTGESPWHKPQHDHLCPHGHQLSPASVFRLLHKLKGKIIFLFLNGWN